MKLGGMLLLVMVVSACGETNYDGNYVGQHEQKQRAVLLTKGHVWCEDTSGVLHKLNARFDLEGKDKSLRIAFDLFACAETESTILYKLEFSESLNCNDRPLTLAVKIEQKALSLRSPDSCFL